MLKNFIYAYICKRYDDDGILPDADEIYEKFKLELDNGAPMEWIDEQMYNFTRHHDLSEITVLWEGKVYKRNEVAV
ncbi:hypothetical protein [Cytobacillus oceanisediminis]|uniref:hypothetical protein n=1 Tax=Cytobacillus oceanisediminis TaxID=665099 RepID=UPI001C226D26|nr:hypothetical protein [Cytobacillus oceanisediminis]MBU8770288.1 hypothetical protein [Cytobacillus oceanisediminis]